MKSSKNKELKSEYKRTHQRMGVYQVRNLINEKVFVGSSLNLDAIINRYRFQLTMGNHLNKDLQNEWVQYGSENFVFEILDELTPSDDPGRDYRDDISFLEEQWIEQLEPFGQRGYNKRKKSTEEKLRDIAKKAGRGNNV